MICDKEMKKTISLTGEGKGKRKIRKITVTGTSTGITLPKFWVKNVEWLKEGEYVMLDFNTDKTITISALPMEETHVNITKYGKKIGTKKLSAEQMKQEMERGMKMNRIQEAITEYRDGEKLSKKQVRQLLKIIKG